MEAITFAGHASHGSNVLLAGALATSAVLVLGYRVYRLSKGGPIADVYGGAVLATLLVVIALLETSGSGWTRWPALVYGIGFGVIVMPVWVLGVLLPLRPAPIDYAATGLYWLSLAIVTIAALL